MLNINRIPTHPGEILLEEFLKPLRMTQANLAHKMGVPIQRGNTLIGGRRDMTPETALLLDRVFKTGPEIWMNLQRNRDLWLAIRKMKKAA